MDTLDERILAALSADARTSFAVIGKAVGLSATAVKRRVDRLRATGVIRVPYLDEDVHDLAGLAQINKYLFATGEERVAMAAGRLTH